MKIKKILLILKTNILFVSLFIVLIIIGVGIKLLLRMKQNIATMESNIGPNYQQLIKYETLKTEAPSPQLISELTKKKEQKRKIFDYVLTKFSTTYPNVPEFKIFPKVEYKEFLLETESYLLKRAKENGIVLPESLGFAETGFPPSSQIPVLSLQLAVLKNFLNLLIDAGVEVVNKVVPGIPSSVSFYQILPLNVSITGTSGQIIRFFKELDTPSSFFVLKNFTIVKVDPGIFKAALTINAIILKKNE
jgi:Tfp pilus assembly protein PilO